ncbi:MAG: NAD(P)-dependent oxidoreductase [Blautia sp.]|nr:NAD(P)-dependent oxidoreductase [Blautia sp.]MCM1201823.1 NAD(P)-dependent oxidoreductase [Bacteroides fragilis]
MNIIVTGANGFIGTNLINELLNEKEYQITALVREKSKRNDLKEEERLSVIEVNYMEEETGRRFHNQDICIHLIGQMGKYGVKEEEFREINVNLTMRILRWCEQEGVKQFIFCSTPGVQGFGHRLAVEEERYAPRNFYEKTKAQAEKEIISFCQKADIKYTIIRPDFVYGPGDRRRIKMYKNIKEKKFILTTSGKAYLHPTYILDVTQGFMKSLGNVYAYNQIFNISAKEDVTSQKYLTIIADCVNSRLIHINIGYKISVFLASIAERVFEKLLKKESFVSKNKIDFLALDHSTSNKKAEKLIGFAPEYDIKKGMEQTISWCTREKLLD